MKDTVLLYWNKSSYLMRSVIVYTFFSLTAIISKLLDDNLGMLSSMIAIGFFVSMLSVVASVLYALLMGIQRKIPFKEIFQAVLVLLFFLSLMSSILPTEIKEDVVKQKSPSHSTIHNIMVLPSSQ